MWLHCHITLTRALFGVGEREAILRQKRTRYSFKPPRISAPRWCPSIIASLHLLAYINPPPRPSTLSSEPPCSLPSLHSGCAGDPHRCSSMLGRWSYAWT
ncbi:hypothetical protein BD311DRAFT_133496 [Dichomitus squalens]|uniref:Uncharacterized protein n=1 Tax=Dichomitus squalens TaxID=114155 RepID=A0A4Q9MUA4_9APHY|nr:hypothetical protein BD311DRAFT_133496 [Dichomitus squalens]